MKYRKNTNVNTSAQTVFQKSLLSLPNHVVVPFPSLICDWFERNSRGRLPFSGVYLLHHSCVTRATINQHSFAFTMQGKNSIQALLLICLLASCQGFKLWNKPRRSPPPPQNEIKTPVIIGNNCFLCHCKIVVSSIRFKTKQRTAPID